MAASSANERLIEVGIEQFGQNGMIAVGTRAIADAAGLQMSAITYHFGGKEGLYRACAQHVAQQMTDRVAPVLKLAEATSTDTGGTAGARAAVLSILSGMVTVMMCEEIAPLALFVVREQMNPTPAFEILYEGTIGRVLTIVGDLLQRVACGTLSVEEMQVRSLALMGQIFIFRFGRATLMRTTRWKSVGPSETEAVRRAVRAHAEAILIELATGARA